MNFQFENILSLVLDSYPIRNFIYEICSIRKNMTAGQKFHTIIICTLSQSDSRLYKITIISIVSAIK